MTEQMKPSGIACVGDIPQDWDVKRLKYACQQITDGSHFSPDTVDDGKVYITVTDLYDDTIHTDTAKRIAPSDFVALVRNGCQPKKGDVLLSKDGTVGRSAIVDSNNDYVVLSSIGILTPRNSMLSRYLKYNLDGIHMQEQMLRAMDGSALKRITISKIAEFFAVIPPINDQKAIADFLDVQCAKIDGIIADLENQIETLQKYKKSLITETVTKGLDKSAPMKDSGIEWIGEIPSGWKVEPIKYRVDFFNGDRGENYPSKAEMLTDGVPFINAGHLLNGGLDMENMDFISEEKYRVMGGVKLQENDILYCLRGSVGKNSILSINRGTVASSLVALRSKNISAKFLYYSLNSNIDEVQRFLWDNGTAQPNLSAENLGKFKICVPPYNEQKAIVDFLDSKCANVDTILNQKEKALTLLQQHKKSLIYEYVTGKKRVTEVN